MAAIRNLATASTGTNHASVTSPAIQTHPHVEDGRAKEQAKKQYGTSGASMSASIAFAVGNALQELDSAVEWFVYRREGDTMDAMETRCVLLNVVARPGIIA